MKVPLRYRHGHFEFYQMSDGRYQIWWYENGHAKLKEFATLGRALVWVQRERESQP